MFYLCITMNFPYMVKLYVNITITIAMKDLKHC